MRTGWLLGALLSLHGSPSIAQSPADDDAIYRPGMEAANQGRNEEALAMFRAIFERYRFPRALVRVALMEIQLGHWLAADDHLSEALASSQDPWIQQNRRRIEEARERASAHIARLEITCDVTGVVLHINGLSEPHFSSPHTVRVLRGRVLVEASAAGHADFREEFDIDVPYVRLPMRMLPLARPPTPASRPVPPPAVAMGGGSSAWLTGAWVGGGLALTSLAFTVLIGVFADQRYNELLQSCSPRCREDDVRDINSRETLVNVGFWTTLSLGAFAVTAAILHRTQPSRPSALRSGVLLGPGVVGLQLGGAL